MKFICFLLLLFVVGCKETSLDLNVPYSGDKLVLSGKLKAGSPIRIQVTRTFNPVGVIPDDVGIADAKVGLVINGEEHIDTTTPIGELIFHVMASLAQFESSLISQRVKAGMARAKAQGKRISRPPLPIHQPELGQPTAARGGRRKRIFTVTTAGKHMLSEIRELRFQLWESIPLSFIS